MENVFIQKVFQLTERLLKYAVVPETVMPELENHLKKARQMNWELYEAETLHAIGVAYLFMGKIDITVDYYKMALEKAESINNIDLICKICCNLGAPLVDKGETEEAIQYADKGIAIVELHQLRTLPCLYLYTTKTSQLIFLQRYAEADETAQKAWELANSIEVKNYTLFGFAAATFHIHQAWLYISIYNRDERRYQGYLAYVRSLAVQLKSYDSELAVCELVHALVMTQDEHKILICEQKVIDLHGGAISLTSLRSLVTYLTHNQCHIWAKKYAQQILDCTKDNPQNNIKYIEHAQRILDAP
jgi:tetratricopeptide (TPR) repeat protein